MIFLEKERSLVKINKKILTMKIMSSYSMYVMRLMIYLSNYLTYFSGNESPIYTFSCEFSSSTNQKLKFANKNFEWTFFPSLKISAETHALFHLLHIWICNLTISRLKRRLYVLYNFMVNLASSFHKPKSSYKPISEDDYIYTILIYTK